MGFYTYLKLFNGIIYLSTLTLAFGYLSSMKFSSKFTFYTFEGLLIIRPILLFLYTLITAYQILNAKKVKSTNQHHVSKSENDSSESSGRDHSKNTSDLSDGKNRG